MHVKGVSGCVGDKYNQFSYHEGSFFCFSSHSDNDESDFRPSGQQSHGDRGPNPDSFHTQDANSTLTKHPQKVIE